MCEKYINSKTDSTWLDTGKLNQFSITIKNFGDLPANFVKAKSIVDTKPLTKESLKQPLSEFNLGPLLPHMEKS